MYGDDLAMLPNEGVTVAKPRTTEFLGDLKRDPVRWRATIYGWIACFCQGSEFATFGFYLPVIFATVGVGTMLGNNLVLMALYSLAVVSGWVGPLITPRIGHRGIGIAGSASCWWGCSPQATDPRRCLLLLPLWEEAGRRGATRTNSA